jgi:hypothetical protein
MSFIAGCNTLCSGKYGIVMQVMIQNVTNRGIRQFAIRSGFYIIGLA